MPVLHIWFNVCVFLFFFNVYLLLREGETECKMGRGTERERETQNPKQSPGFEPSAQS